MERKQDGEIAWTVETVREDGQLITELRFEKQSSGLYAGEYHPMFYEMDQIFLSQFIERDYKLWRAYLGNSLIGSNIVRRHGRILSADEARQAVEEFSSM